MKIRILATRHSAFYGPLLATVAGGFLRDEGLEATYDVLAPGKTLKGVLEAGEADVCQSAVSTNWDAMERGERHPAAHFAQINQRDGFFLVARRPDPAFSWKRLEGAEVLADHGRQPLAMLKFAAREREADWSKVRAVDAGTPAEMDAAFRAGRGDYVHLQGPFPQQLAHDGVGFIVAAVGEAMAPLAFSSLAATREFLATDPARGFSRALRKACRWIVEADAGDVARTLSPLLAGIDAGALAATVERYRKLGTWSAEVAIPRELYEQSLHVFRTTGGITQRHAYEEVVVPVP